MRITCHYVLLTCTGCVYKSTKTLKFHTFNSQLLCLPTTSTALWLERTPVQDPNPLIPRSSSKCLDTYTMLLKLLLHQHFFLMPNPQQQVQPINANPPQRRRILPKRRRCLQHLTSDKLASQNHQTTQSKLCPVSDAAIWTTELSCVLRKTLSLRLSTARPARYRRRPTHQTLYYLSTLNCVPPMFETTTFKLRTQWRWRTTPVSSWIRFTTCRNVAYLFQMPLYRWDSLQRSYDPLFNFMYHY